MAYSIDFRKKVLSYCERTGSITEASHVFQISRNTIYGWLKLKEKTEELNHQVKGTKPRQERLIEIDLKTILLTIQTLI